MYRHQGSLWSTCLGQFAFNLCFFVNKATQMIIIATIGQQRGGRDRAHTCKLFLFIYIFLFIKMEVLHVLCLLCVHLSRYGGGTVSLFQVCHWSCSLLRTRPWSIQSSDTRNPPPGEVKASSLQWTLLNFFPTCGQNVFLTAPCGE